MYFMYTNLSIKAVHAKVKNSHRSVKGILFQLESWEEAPQGKKKRKRSGI